MTELKSSNESEVPGSLAESTGRDSGGKGKSWRVMAAGAYAGLLVLAFGPIIWALALHAADNELHSHVLLIPFISIYLVYIERAGLPRAYRTSPVLGSIATVVGFSALAFAWRFFPVLSANDYLALMTLSFLCLLVAGGFYFLGKRWLAAAAFPVAFLVFMIPMPDAMADALETASKYASAEAANVFFGLSGVPYLRSGQYFQLPNITLEVAQECSGIRSSWVLLITSLLASHMFLKTPWRRAILVAFVIPLGILRNGLRILVIGLLCVNFGPQMIDSLIHRRGGPFFFVLSLVPLFLLLWFLRRGENEKTKSETLVGEATKITS